MDKPRFQIQYVLRGQLDTIIEDKNYNSYRRFKKLV